MDPIVAQELIRAIQRDLEERVGSASAPPSRHPSSLVQEGSMNRPLRSRIGYAVRRFLAEPAPEARRRRSASQSTRDSWILHGPRWH